jgi:restriction system protein
MAIPDFQSIMLPLLKCLADDGAKTNEEIVTCLIRHFQLTDEEVNALLESGKQRVFGNRIAWAKSYLKQAGLVESPERGIYRITKKGVELLADNLERINIKLLLRYPEFREFRGKRDKNGTSDAQTHAEEIKTPQEYIELGYKRMMYDVSKEIMENIQKRSAYFFEKLVVDLLLAMGYGGSRSDAGSLSNKGADEGIDGVINEDRLGLDVIYVQAKKWQNSIGRPEIQKFAGALMGKKAKKGVFITTSCFTKEARDFAKSIESKIVLIDGEKLAALMIECNVGVSVSQRYEIKKIDLDYFSEEQ